MNEYNNVDIFQLLKENKIDYYKGKSEQGWLNVVYRDVWFELAFFNNVLAAVNFNNKPFWSSVKSFIRGLHMTHRKPFSELWGKDNEVNQIYYKWYIDMVHKIGDLESFTVVLPICITEKSLEKDLELFEDITRPLVSGLARGGGGAGGPRRLGLGSKTPGRLRRKNVAGSPRSIPTKGSRPRSPPEMGLGRSPNGGGD